MFDHLPVELILLIVEASRMRDACQLAATCRRLWLIARKIIRHQLYCPLHPTDPFCESFIDTFRDIQFVDETVDPLHEHKAEVRSLVRRVTIHTRTVKPSLCRVQPWWSYHPVAIDVPTLRYVLSLFPRVETIDLISIAIIRPSSDSHMSRHVRYEARHFTGASIVALHVHSVELNEGAELSFMRFVETLPNLLSVRMHTASRPVAPSVVSQRRLTPGFTRLALDLSISPACMATGLYPSLHLIPAYQNISQLQIWCMRPSDLPFLRRLLAASSPCLEVITFAVLGFQYWCKFSSAISSLPSTYMLC